VVSLIRVISLIHPIASLGWTADDEEALEALLPAIFRTYLACAAVEGTH